jgi:hypothetical protein
VVLVGLGLGLGLGFGLAAPVEGELGVLRFSQFK